MSESKNASAQNPEPAAIPVQDRIVVAMFMIVGFVFMAASLVDLVVGLFR